MSHKIHFASQFSRTPGGRLSIDGPHSGEEFRKRFLDPLFADVYDETPIEINVDDIYGIAPCFMQEAFIELAIVHGFDRVRNRLTFSGDEDLAKDIRWFIEECLREMEE